MSHPVTIKRQPLQLRWPLFRIYDEDGNVGIAWRRPWYRHSSFLDLIGVKYDISEQFNKWVLSLESMLIRWHDVHPRDPMIHSTPARNPVAIKHEWIKDVCCTTDPATHHNCCFECCCHPENYNVATPL